MKLKIKELRKQKKLSQKDLSEKSGISERMLSDYENEIADISLNKLQNIASILNCAVSELIGEEIPIIQQAQGNVSIEENNQTGNNYQKISGNGKYIAGSRNVISEFGSNKDKFDELMEIIREKDKQIESLHKIIDKLSK
jgi:transcriptional regulator